MPFSFICYKYEKLIDIKITFPEEVEERNVVFEKGFYITSTKKSQNMNWTKKEK